MGKEGGREERRQGKLQLECKINYLNLNKDSTSIMEEYGKRKLTQVSHTKRKFLWSFMYQVLRGTRITQTKRYKGAAAWASESVNGDSLGLQA